MKMKLRALLFVTLVAFGPATGLCQTAGPKAPSVPAVVTPAKVVPDTSAPPGWQRYQFGDRPAFSAILPAVPEATAERAPNSTSITSIYTATNTGGIYVVGRVDEISTDIDKAPEATREKFFKEFFAGFAEGFKEGLAKSNFNFQLQLLNPKKVMTATGREGFQQDMTIGPFKGQAQLVFAGRSALCVVAIWNASAPPAELEAFFKSFKITVPG